MGAGSYYTVSLKLKIEEGEMDILRFDLSQEGKKFKVLNATNRGPYSHDIPCIFLNYDADPCDPASYDFA